MSDGDDSSSDGGWGDGFNAVPANQLLEHESDEGRALFCPDPVINLVEKPQLPMLSQESLSPGTPIWLADSEDVSMLLGAFWEDYMLPYCCATVEGTVVRHSGAGTLVRFPDASGEVDIRFTVPRVCLFDKPVTGFSTSPKRVQKNFNLGQGNLDPKKNIEKKNVAHQQQAPMFDASVVGVLANCAPTTHLAELLNQNNLNAAQEALDPLLRRKDVSNLQKELFICRSAVHLQKCDYAAAEQDAIACVQLHPSWARGYLQAATVLEAQGRLGDAESMLRQVAILVPGSEEVYRRQSVLQNLLDSASLTNKVRIAYRSGKRVALANEALPVGVFHEETATALVPSLGNKGVACGWGAAPLRTDAPVRCRLGCDAKYNSEAAEDAAFKAYHCYECSKATAPGTLGIRSGQMLIRDKAATSINVTLLDKAQLALRWFVEILVQQEAGQDPYLELFTPFPNVALEEKYEKELQVLHRVVTEPLTPKTKSFWTLATFRGLFACVISGAARVEVDSDCAFLVLAPITATLAKSDGEKPTNVRVSVRDNAVTLAASSHVSEGNELVA